MDDKEVEEKLKKLEKQAQRDSQKNDRKQDKKSNRKKKRKNTILAVVIVAAVAAAAAVGLYETRGIRTGTEMASLSDEAGSVAESVSGYGAEAEPESETEEETSAESEAEPAYEAGSEAGTELAAEAETEPENETGSEAGTEPADEAGSEAATEPADEAGSEAATEPADEADSEAGTEPAEGTETEPEDSTETDLLSDSEIAAAFEEEIAAETGEEADLSAEEDTSAESGSGNLSGWAAAAVAAKDFRTTVAEGDFAFVSLDGIPEYSGSPYVIINGNEPFFSDSDYTTEVFETYSDLDGLGRCGPAYANLCKELMPTGRREYIRNIYPSGYHNAKYSFIDGEYVYNRCHLIAFSLAGESANEKNLITGTQYLNIDGMYPFEYMVGDHIRRADDHVLYRVTPIFEGDDLVASGVLIEASSVEDRGEGLKFCVYCYNVQPGVEINYATGRTQADGTMQ